MPSNVTKYQASSLETIDTGLYEWVNEFLDVHTQTNKGMFKVPVLWLVS